MAGRLPFRRRPLVAILVLVAVALAAVGGWRWWGGDASASTSADAHRAGKVPVTVETVAKGDFPVNLDGLGTVAALNTVTIRAQVTGLIQEIAFGEGQIVHRGDVLVRIDPRPLQAALDQARAKLAQDQASLADAQTNLNRYKVLANQQFTSRQQLDTQASTVAQLTASVAGDQAAVENATVQLDYATIRSPITGRAGFRLVDVGNLVTAGGADGIVTIQQVQPIAVEFTAPETRLPDISAALAAGDAPVAALASDKSATLATGTLKLADNSVDTATGTIKLKAEFPNADGALWPGMSVATRLLLRTERGVPLIADDAVQHGPDGLFVYLAGDDGKAKLRPVTVSGEEDGRAWVSAGLQSGERVVTEGQYRVQDGSELDARQAKPKPGAPAAAPGDTPVALETGGSAGKMQN